VQVVPCALLHDILRALTKIEAKNCVLCARTMASTSYIFLGFSKCLEKSRKVISYRVLQLHQSKSNYEAHLKELCLLESLTMLPRWLG
jgi:hypothetical protein